MAKTCKKIYKNLTPCNNVLYVPALMTSFAVFLSAVSGASNKVKACSFDNDMCDWHNVPFDDDMDFVIRSSSSGGPSSGAGGSGE